MLVKALVVMDSVFKVLQLRGQVHLAARFAPRVNVTHVLQGKESARWRQPSRFHMSRSARRPHTRLSVVCRSHMAAAANGTRLREGLEGRRAAVRTTRPSMSIVQ